MKKHILWLSWLIFSVFSSLVQALELGRPSVNSSLNTPLNVTIPLVDSEAYSLGSLGVSVADNAAFSAYNLEWHSLAGSVQTRINEQPSGRQLVLHTQQSVDTPWLDLLLTIAYPGGQQHHAITLLFDPAEYPVHTSARLVSKAENDLTVASGDTLWSVAARIKPANATEQQVILALVEANPLVFPTGNIDSVRAGQRLNRPSSQAIGSRSNAEAAHLLQAMRMRQPDANAAAEEPTGQLLTTTDSGMAIAWPSELTGEPDVSPGDITRSLKDAGQPQVIPPRLPVGPSPSDWEEQLRTLQVLMQLIVDEREQLQVELSDLRHEVVLLMETLSSSPDVSEQPVAASTLPIAPSHVPANHVQASMQRYGWPLIGTVLGLLLGALIWFRKRREQAWEVPTAPSSVGQPVSSFISQPASDTTKGTLPGCEPSSAGASEPMAVKCIAMPNQPTVKPSVEQVSDTRRQY